MYEQQCNKVQKLQKQMSNTIVTHTFGTV